MRRGTTPTHTFSLPFDTSEITSVRIVYAQNGRPIVVKKTKDVSKNGSAISVKLTQKDTLAFRSDCDVDIQVRILVREDALASEPIRVKLETLYDDEVLV